MDKELALIIAEMLIKQDETTAQMKEVNAQLKKNAKQTLEITSLVTETNGILRDFMGISIKQWEEQHKFNGIIVPELKGIKEVLVDFARLDSRLKAVEEREDKFETRLSTIEKMLKAS